MRPKITLFHVFIVALFGIFFLNACGDDSEWPLKYVDLRFLAEDEYSLPAKDPEQFVLQVKSTDPWEVFNTNANWASITPSSGPADELFEVVVAYTDNGELDDRLDTITIKSDFWIGKQIIVNQKGIAYLLADYDGDIVMSQDEDTYTVGVLANQNWSSKVTQGEEWLSVKSGNTGALDGTVTIATLPNKGERRVGEITLYDRHGVERVKVPVTQNGLQLDPEIVYLRINHESQQVVIPVISNAEWTVAKEDDNLEWFSFPQTSFSGDQSVVIEVDENQSIGVRTAVIVLSTVPVEGSIPVVKTITFKQANNNLPTRYEFDATEASKWSVNQGSPVVIGDDVSFTGASRYLRSGFEPGLYSFRIKSMTANAYSRIFITQGAAEIRLHIDGPSGRTFITPTPWVAVSNPSVDITVPNTLGVNITASEKGGTIDIEYFLNGVSFQKITDFGMDPQKPFDMFLGGSAGTVVYDWYEYSPPIDWGD